MFFLIFTDGARQSVSPQQKLRLQLPHDTETNMSTLRPQSRQIAHVGNLRQQDAISLVSLLPRLLQTASSARVSGRRRFARAVLSRSTALP